MSEAVTVPSLMMVTSIVSEESLLTQARTHAHMHAHTHTHTHAQTDTHTQVSSTYTFSKVVYDSEDYKKTAD